MKTIEWTVRLCKLRSSRERKFSPKFSDWSFWKSLMVVDVRAFGSWMSAPKCLFSQDFERPDRSFGPGYPREWPPGCPREIRPKNFLFGLIFRSWSSASCQVPTFPVNGERKKHIKKKTRKQNIHGIIPGFLGDFVYVFFLTLRNDPKNT